MNTKTFRVMWRIMIIFMFILSIHSVGTAQNKSGKDGVYMTASSINIGKGIIVTGYFNRKHQPQKNQDWCVFIADNGRVYKLWLTGQKITSLYIDGQKIDDSQIAKHSPDYQPYLSKHWRNLEIENKSRELEAQMKPIDRKIENLDQEIEKLEAAEEKLERLREKKVGEFADERRNISAQQRKLNEMQRKHERELEVFSSEEEKLSLEQETLGLDREMDKVLARISEDLKALGVIRNSTNLSFKLSNLELVVNGKKASPEVYEKLKARYIVDLGDEAGFLYRWKWTD